MSIEDSLLEINKSIKEQEDIKKELEGKLKAAHPRQPGIPVQIRGQNHTLSYLYVRYTEGKVEVIENYSQSPEWNATKKEFETWSPFSVKPEDVKYLETLSKEELERLQDLNSTAYYEYADVDSKSEAHKLETERIRLAKRCGHLFDYNTKIFSSYESYTCKKCYLILEPQED